MRYDFRKKKRGEFVLTPSWFVGGVHVLFILIVFIYVYVYWCPTRLPYQMMFASFNSNTTGVTCGAETANPPGAHEFIPVFSGVPVAPFLVFCVMFCISLFVLFPLVIVLSVL